MTTFSRIVSVISIAMLMSVAMPIFAESAPVYDADSMPQFDPGADQGQQDQGQDLPPPPPPEQEGTFAPMQQQQTSSLPPSSGPMSESMNMDQRIRRVEQQINNMQNNDASVRVDSLTSQIQALRGQVEQLTHQLQQLQNQQKSMYAGKQNQSPNTSATDTDLAASSDEVTATTKANKSSRKTPIAKLAARAAADASATDNTSDTTSDNTSSPSPTPDTTVTKSVNDQPNVAEEQQIYQTAYSLIKTKKYNDAVDALQKMLKKYPSGQFASNAHYWLGELYGLMGKNDQALTEFGTVVRTFPDSPRISDAQLKVGLIYASQTKWSDAKNAFKKVINHYPGTASARLASEQLKQIRQAGH
jgi:tol-pal system protein YbgF